MIYHSIESSCYGPHLAKQNIREQLFKEHEYMNQELEFPLPAHAELRKTIQKEVKHISIP